MIQRVLGLTGIEVVLEAICFIFVFFKCGSEQGLLVSCVGKSAL